ncbi:hypothetical protein E2C01_017144 [Portunus trituberculatus]|uniref:Uncharacterized protein n=1 Tax=Portunus trituberculatus TaxID=210409 RepID=A0A5B7DSL4_PORTR|nr:hypothetical protein [Portunus trituberculatus]
MHLYHTSVYEKTILLTLGRVYGGQKIDGQSSLFQSTHKFLKLHKITK